MSSPVERQVWHHNIRVASFAVILQAIVEPPLISERGDDVSTLFFSECTSDNDLGRSHYALDCGRVAI